MRTYFFVILVVLIGTSVAYAAEKQTVFFPIVKVEKEECFGCPCLGEGENAFILRDAYRVYVGNVYVTTTGKLIKLVGGGRRVNYFGQDQTIDNTYYESDSYFKRSHSALPPPLLGQKGNFYYLDAYGFILYAEFVN